MKKQQYYKSTNSYRGTSGKCKPRVNCRSKINNNEAFEIELLDLMNKSGGLHLHQLTKQTGKPKTEINSILYNMQGRQLVCRSEKNPPMWSVLAEGRKTCLSSSPKQNQALKPESRMELKGFGNAAPFSRPNAAKAPPSSVQSPFEAMPRLLTPGDFTVKPSSAANEISTFAEDVKLGNESSFGRNFVTLGATPPVSGNNSTPRCGFGDRVDRMDEMAPSALPPARGLKRLSSERDVDVETKLCDKTSTTLSISGDALTQDSTKNAISKINEYAQAKHIAIEFKYQDEGPPHKKRFLATLTLGEKVFPPAEGGSKKDAKLKAAELALQRVFGSPPPTVGPVSQPSPADVGRTPICDASNLQSSSKNAVSMINEYAQAQKLAIEFLCDLDGPDHSRRFITTLKLGSSTFPPVEASSKKESKLKAAESAVAILRSTGKMASSSFDPNLSEETHHPLSITFHDRVAVCVKRKFEELLAGLPDTIVGRKIIAGFVMSRTKWTECGEENEWIVVSVSSGNRCVAGDKLSMKGETVNDCHAEVIARRGLVRFLYQKILLYKSNPGGEENIFEQGKEKLCLQKGVKFHLYISTAPCGDSALFAKSDMDCETDDVVDNESGHKPVFENKKQGILRTKVENGEGCIPIEDDANVPTWDGLLRGERLRTMSCSDKLMKWNFLGLQGALLSHLVEPIYMSSLTLGMLYNHGHLTRAICCRLEKYLKQINQPLKIPRGYKVHHPSVAKISGDDPGRDTGKVKTREFSVNWTDGDEFTEVLDGTKGRCEARYGCVSPISQVCKANLYKLFLQVFSNTQFNSYGEAKKAAEQYQTAKQQMKRAFEAAGCGKWMYKPAEEEDF